MKLVRVFVGARGAEESAASLDEVVEQIKRRLEETYPGDGEVVVLESMTGLEVAAYHPMRGLDLALSRKIEEQANEWAWEAVKAALGRRGKRRTSRAPHALH